MQQRVTKRHRPSYSEWRKTHPPIAGGAGTGAVESLEVLGVAKETTYGTLATPTKFIPGHAAIASQTKLARPPQSRGTRSQVFDAVVGYETTVTITAELIPEVLSSLVCGWFGSGADVKTGSSNAGFTHTMTPQDYLDSFSFEHDIDISSQILARQILGCQVDQMIFRAPNQALTTTEFQLIGQREVTPVTPGQPSNPTPSLTTIQPMDFSLIAATYEGSASTQFMDVTLTAMNHCQRIYSSNNKLYLQRIAATLREVQLATTLDFLDTTFYNRWLNFTKTSAGGIVLTWTSLANIAGSSPGTPYSVQFTLLGVRPSGPYPLTAANDVITQPMTFSVTVPASGSNNELSAVIINGESSTLP